MIEDRLFLADVLEANFEELEPLQFYRCIFPYRSLENKGEYIEGKYNAIAVELLKKEEAKELGRNVNRYTITDDLDNLEMLLESDNFVLLSPITYIGKSRKSENARLLYAIAIDLDGVETMQNVRDLIHQIDIEHLPRPTYIVWSGTGYHLYYAFVKPIPCFKNLVKQLTKLKNALTRKIWNGYITTLEDNVQIESLFQGFRMVGGITKGGNRTRAFIVGNKVTIEYLNNFVSDFDRVKDITYASKNTLKQAAVKYPQWYEKRIIKKQPIGTWQNKIDLYNWWLSQIKNKSIVGHRYYNLMILCIYAKKCGVDREQLENDCFELVETLDKLTTNDNNHFTREDVLAALEIFQDSYIRFPIDSISRLSGIPIQKNKRNYRTQETHLKIMRSTRDILYPNKEYQYRGGRVKGTGKKIPIIKQWRLDNPHGTPQECIIATGISKSTIYKYWNNCTTYVEHQKKSKRGINNG